MKHYKDKLTAYLHHELAADERSVIAEHIMVCSECRAEHDHIKLGSDLAARLSQTDAPTDLWARIEDDLDEKRPTQMTLIPQTPFFGFRSVVGYAVGLLVVASLVTVAYFTMFRTGPDMTAHREEVPQVVPGDVHMPVNMAPAVDPPANSEQPSTNTNTSNSNIVSPPVGPAPELASAGGAWQFQTLAGSPKVGAASGPDRLVVGDSLETDTSSRARIMVANIGSVDIEPNSRIKLIGTDSTEHRISLERGVLQAKILAPPRLFIVDTPSAVAVDLGCEYKLEVDKAGNSYLHVTSGFVALERGGRESIVPAGAYCVTKRGKGLGTPYSAETTDAFKAALNRFDFLGGGTAAIDEILKLRNFYDMITLWHLLSRVNRTDREKVFNALSEYVKPPAEVSREGILKLDKRMLESWRTEVERVWFD